MTLGSPGGRGDGTLGRVRRSSRLPSDPDDWTDARSAGWGRSDSVSYARRSAMDRRAGTPAGLPPESPRSEPRPGTGQARLAEVARGGTLNLAGAAVAAIAILGVTVLVTRVFPRPVAGAFFTATSAFIIVEAVASLGANVGLVYFIARLRSLG